MKYEPRIVGCWAVWHIGRLDQNPTGPLSFHPEPSSKPAYDRRRVEHGGLRTWIA